MTFVAEYGKKYRIECLLCRHSWFTDWDGELIKEEQMPEHTSEPWGRGVQDVVDFQNESNVPCVCVGSDANNPDGKCLDDEPNNGRWVAICFGPDSEANAALIIAAPKTKRERDDLLAACEGIADRGESYIRDVLKWDTKKSEKDLCDWMARDQTNFHVSSSEMLAIYRVIKAMRKE